MVKINYDKNQLDAIKSRGNTIVIAGAGAGKTSTISGKINHFIENKIYQENDILVISFTNETVNSLKKKIKYHVDIKTFHKLALDIISDEHTKIVTDYELKYIINEYLDSYVVNNKKLFNIYKRILSIKERQEFINLVSAFINIYKANYSDINKLLALYKKSLFVDKLYLRLIIDIYIVYQRELESSGKVDFNDLISLATNKVNNTKDINYKYIIIDEFQDSSVIRFNLIKAILKINNGKVFVVGDDYQSIYRFSGSNLSLFTRFNNLINDLEVIHLNNNYRNSQDLINIANNFIMKNKNQIKKKTICHKNLIKPIKIVYYRNKKEVIGKLLNLIDGKVLILGRNNVDKENYAIHDHDNARFLTIHRSKGLEEDNIILINLYNNKMGFPSQIKKANILAKILETDYIIHEEERRLFYVALTRTKNYVYLLVPYYNESVFIRELIRDNRKNLDFIHLK